jgi:hypothetical protein
VALAAACASSKGDNGKRKISDDGGDLFHDAAALDGLLQHLGVIDGGDDGIADRRIDDVGPGSALRKASSADASSTTLVTLNLGAAILKNFLGEQYASRYEAGEVGLGLGYYRSRVFTCRPASSATTTTVSRSAM